MIVSAYDQDENGKESKLIFWLRLDAWDLFQATHLFLDLDPDNCGRNESEYFTRLVTFKGNIYPEYDDRGYPIIEQCMDDGETLYLGWEEASDYTHRFKVIFRLLDNKLKPIKYASPQDWVDLAISKNISIPWYDWAIRNKLIGSGEIFKPLSTRTENNYLRLIMALAYEVQGFNPKKPYEAAQLIIDKTEIDISKETLAAYISKAYEIESHKRD